MSEPVFEVVDIGRLEESPLNPRQHYDPKKIEELAERMKGDAPKEEKKPEVQTSAKGEDGKASGPGKVKPKKTKSSRTEAL